MTILGWVKRTPFYQPARAAALSLAGPTRFYNPISAARLVDSEREDIERGILKTLALLGNEDGLSIWSTPAGEVATIETETAEHVAFLLAEFHSHPYFSHSVHVKPGEVVLDIGANIGLFTRQALEAGAGRVVCFEPVTGIRQALSWNLRAAIAAGKVSLIEKGAWNCADTLVFTVDPKRPARSSCVQRPDEASAFEMRLAVDRLDDMVRELGLPKIDFIKMDIEGAECSALLGAADTLRRQKPKLAIAVEHTADRLENARSVRESVLRINPKYRWHPGRYSVNRHLRLVPEILYFR